ncbi:MAG: serine--tRNA ligase [Candidatus Diapherotrites archaeon]|uniref:Serine--tRNA ligase n=1 Tax=Candidatus Iainarchaeum sp. TaxID=3101447 RepID=A0A7J4JU34_9ARCH|nr:serine--tRNA ligase [Candidatus Diapherotrites archaeon]HIH21293.1 serine--tRNA ligase [Candidatus Diapherotrites archaeon]
MLDISFVRQNPLEVRSNLAKRQDKGILERFDSLLSVDKEWRSLKQKVDELRSMRNLISKEIEALVKQGKATQEKINEARAIPEQIKSSEARMRELDEKRLSLLMAIPNLLHESVPFGKDETENKVIRVWGKLSKPDFEIQHHGQLAVRLGGADFEKAVQVSGEGFYFLKNELALMEQALSQYAIHYLVKKGFTFVKPPFLLRRKPLSGALDLSEFESVIYKIEGEDHYLIGTAEHSLNALHFEEILDSNQLPLLYAGFSTNFRKEIGKHGLDERGLFRLHQFDKVEQFVFCKPEDSWKLHERLLKNAEEIVQGLELPYRVVNVCTGDIGTVAAKKYDIECWSPREGKYFETHSLSNCTSYQAVRSGIKYRISQTEKAFVHTLNATAIAAPRALRAILENHQSSDGTVKVPKALQPFMLGVKEIVPLDLQKQKPQIPQPSKKHAHKLLKRKPRRK